MLVLMWLSGSLIVSILIGVLAESKRRSGIGWWIGGLLTCLILSPVVGLLLLLTLGFMPAIPAKGAAK